MRRWIVLLTMAVVVLLVAGDWAARRSWDGATLDALEVLGRSTGNLGEAQNGDIERLPPVAERYFRFALPPGQRPIRSARLAQGGEFATKPGQWQPFKAVEYFSARAPGFVWDARIQMLPAIPVLVRDSYLAGEGAMLARLRGSIPMVDQRGTRELAEAALMRWLAEAVWIPTALLPGPGVEWSGSEDGGARVTVLDHGVRVSVDLEFGALGEIVKVKALRYRDVAGRLVATPWMGRFGPYERRDGMQIPGSAEVAWVVDGSEQPYWRGRLLEVRYSY
ncbi:MAG: hypothetical protein HY821_22280 [Acidobacteria bacterium]|nr:hypothetical protein [Acidobacteriota bacterium]